VTAKVTIGIPTRDRPALLDRALRSVARQDLESVHVLVADNASPGDATEQVVDSFRAAMPSLSFHRHSTDIGVWANLRFLLNQARTPYFMWLADDDEISAGYVQGLLAILEADPTAACAMGRWVVLTSPSAAKPMRTSQFGQRGTLNRLLRYVWRADDSFFYGLHRTDVLRRASFPGYSWPNRSNPINWAYVFLFDVVAEGRIVVSHDSSIQFLNHDYTTKSYAKSRGGVTSVPRRVARRLNVHLLYWVKATRHLGYAVLPLFVLVSLGSLAREAARRLTGVTIRAARPSGNGSGRTP
jgi:glycosyltransferase involved in cell wall biosynthesis